MPGPWVTDDELSAYLASILAVGGTGGLKIDAATFVPAANTAAYTAILQKLQGQGYTVAQLDTWRDRAVFNQQVGAYFALRDNSAQLQDVDLYPEKYKWWLDQLDAWVLYDDAGDPIELEDDATGASHGDLDACKNTLARVRRGCGGGRCC